MRWTNVLGRLFQATGPATQNARLPSCSFVLGATKSPRSAERRAKNLDCVQRSSISTYRILRYANRHYITLHYRNSEIREGSVQLSFLSVVSRLILLAVPFANFCSARKVICVTNLCHTTDCRKRLWSCTLWRYTNMLIIIIIIIIWHINWSLLLLTYLLSNRRRKQNGA